MCSKYVKMQQLILSSDLTKFSFRQVHNSVSGNKYVFFKTAEMFLAGFNSHRKLPDKVYDEPGERIS